MPDPQASSRRSIAVVGAGYVGLVSAVGFAGMGHSIELVETDPDRLVVLRQGQVPFSEDGVLEALSAAISSGDLKILERTADVSSEIVLICVGTPIDDLGHADMGAVKAVLAELGSLETRPITVVRSTMPVGTSEQLRRDGGIIDEARFFSVPEFLRQGAVSSKGRARPSFR